MSWFRVEWRRNTDDVDLCAELFQTEAYQAASGTGAESSSLPSYLKWGSLVQEHGGVDLEQGSRGPRVANFLDTINIESSCSPCKNCSLYLTRQKELHSRADVRVSLALGSPTRILELNSFRWT